MPVLHWLDQATKEHKLLNLNGHQNKPRMSANTILALIQLRNKLSGNKTSVFEASVQAEDQVVL